jgi:hypothetical protein
MPQENLWDTNLQQVFGLNGDVYGVTINSEEILENLIILNTDVGGLDRNNLGVVGMMSLDMRVDIEECIDMLSATLAKLQMALLSVTTMENNVRALLPEFTINYEDYKKDIMERKWGKSSWRRNE